MRRSDFLNRKEPYVGLCNSKGYDRVTHQSLRAGRDERGNLKVVVVDEFELQEKIESFEKGCDVHEIVKRYNLTGDISALNINPALFGLDGTIIPKDMRELLDTLNGVRDTYARLSQEEAKKYSSFEDFLKRIPEFVASKMPQNASNSSSKAVSSDPISNSPKEV